MKFLSHLLGAAALAACLAPVAAQADIADAIRAQHSHPYVKVEGTLMPSSILPGFYGLVGENPSSPLEGMVLGFNESFALTLSDSGRHSHLVPDRYALTPEEEHAWVGEVMRSLDTSRLITYKFGAGTRKLYLVTAYDCPACINLERRLTKLAPKLNATVYMVPIVLRPNSQSLATYNAIACAANPAAEWRKALVERKFPTRAVPDCGAPTLLDTVTAAIALGELATPAIFREDGTMSHGAGEDADLVRAFSEAGAADLRGNVFNESSTFTLAGAFADTVRPAPRPQAQQPALSLGGILNGVLGAARR